jgi:iron complex transport system ATP-binding protein
MQTNSSDLLVRLPEPAFQPMLEVEQLSVHYGERQLWLNLSFSLPPQAFVAVIGHNGCGKTTLFQAFFNKVPYAGNVRLAGRSLRGIRNPAAAGLISFLPQKSSPAFSLPVRELAVMGRFRFKKFLEPYNATDYRLAEKALSEMGVLDLKNADCQILSGGELQMVWLAQLGLQQTPICLLDEPTQQLDVRNRKKVFDQMSAWAKEKLVICITHDLHELQGRDGFLLNLSKPQPALEILNTASLAENEAFLRQESF